MKLLTVAPAITALMSPGLALAQNANMMNGGWMGGWMGGYGGVWLPVLLIIVVGIVAWVVMQKRK